jgi:hypothetical protein
MFDNRTNPHEVVLLGVVSFLVDLFVFSFFVVVILVIIVSGVLGVVASGCRCLEGWCRRCWRRWPSCEGQGFCQRGGRWQPFLWDVLQVYYILHSDGREIRRNFLDYHWVDRDLPGLRGVAGVDAGSLESANHLQEKCQLSWISKR